MSESEAGEKVATIRVEREHRWFEYGRWFSGFGSSMDPHVCGEDGTVCEWRERTVTTAPWSDWTPSRPVADNRQETP